MVMTTTASSRQPAAATRAKRAAEQKPARVDLIEDARQRLHELPASLLAALQGLPEVRAELVAHFDGTLGAVRNDWLHERLTVCRDPVAAENLRTQRDAAIVRDYLAGERLGLLRRRYGISERRILQIIKA